jgi:hypothetical protein
MVVPKITIKHEHYCIVMGVAACHGLVCAVYSLDTSCAWRYVDCDVTPRNLVAG